MLWTPKLEEAYRDCLAGLATTENQRMREVMGAAPRRVQCTKSPPGPTQRDRIIHFIRRRDSVTVRDVQKAFKGTCSQVWGMIGGLTRDHLVTVETGGGEVRYSLTDRGRAMAKELEKKWLGA